MPSLSSRSKAYEQTSPGIPVTPPPVSSSGADGAGEGIRSSSSSSVPIPAAAAAVAATAQQPPSLEGVVTGARPHRKSSAKHHHHHHHHHSSSNSRGKVSSISRNGNGNGNSIHSDGSSSGGGDNVTSSYTSPPATSSAASLKSAALSSSPSSSCFSKFFSFKLLVSLVLFTFVVVVLVILLPVLLVTAEATINDTAHVTSDQHTLKTREALEASINQSTNNVMKTALAVRHIPLPYASNNTLEALRTLFVEKGSLVREDLDGTVQTLFCRLADSTLINTRRAAGKLSIRSYQTASTYRDGIVRDIPFNFGSIGVNLTSLEVIPDVIPDPSKVPFSTRSAVDGIFWNLSRSQAGDSVPASQNRWPTYVVAPTLDGSLKGLTYFPIFHSAFAVGTVPSAEASPVAFCGQLLSVSDFSATLRENLVGGDDARAFVVSHAGTVLSYSHGPTLKIVNLTDSGGELWYGCLRNPFGGTMACFYNVSEHQEYHLLRHVDGVWPLDAPKPPAALPPGVESVAQEHRSFNLELDDKLFEIDISTLRSPNKLWTLKLYSFVPKSFFLNDVRKARDLAIGIVVTVVIVCSVLGYFLLSRVAKSVEDLSERMGDPWNVVLPQKQEEEEASDLQQEEKRREKLLEVAEGKGPLAKMISKNRSNEQQHQHQHHRSPGTSPETSMTNYPIMSGASLDSENNDNKNNGSETPRALQLHPPCHLSEGGRTHQGGSCDAGAVPNDGDDGANNKGGKSVMTTISSWWEELRDFFQFEEIVELEAVFYELGAITKEVRSFIHSSKAFPRVRNNNNMNNSGASIMSRTVSETETSQTDGPPSAEPSEAGGEGGGDKPHHGDDDDTTTVRKTSSVSPGKKRVSFFTAVVDPEEASTTDANNHDERHQMTGAAGASSSSEAGAGAGAAVSDDDSETASAATLESASSGDEATASSGDDESGGGDVAGRPASNSSSPTRRLRSVKSKRNEDRLVSAAAAAAAADLFAGGARRLAPIHDAAPPPQLYCCCAIEFPQVFFTGESQASTTSLLATLPNNNNRTTNVVVSARRAHGGGGGGDALSNTIIEKRVQQQQNYDQLSKYVCACAQFVHVCVIRCGASLVNFMGDSALCCFRVSFHKPKSRMMIRLLYRLTKASAELAERFGTSRNVGSRGTGSGGGGSSGGESSTTNISAQAAAKERGGGRTTRGDHRSSTAISAARSYVIGAGISVGLVRCLQMSGSESQLATPVMFFGDPVTSAIELARREQVNIDCFSRRELWRRGMLSDADFFDMNPPPVVTNDNFKFRSAVNLRMLMYQPAAMRMQPYIKVAPFKLDPVQMSAVLARTSAKNSGSGSDSKIPLEAASQQQQQKQEQEQEHNAAAENSDKPQELPSSPNQASAAASSTEQRDDDGASSSNNNNNKSPDASSSPSPSTAAADDDGGTSLMATSDIVRLVGVLAPRGGF